VLARINYYIRFLSVLSFLKLYNLFLINSSYYWSLISKKIKHKGLPWSLSVETGTHCNLSCLECPSGQKQFTRNTGTTTIENFQQIIDKQYRTLIWLILYFQGEPYMNPSFFEMVAYARSKNIFCTTSTNAHFLSKENAVKTVKSGLDRLVISLDGLDQKTYEKYRVGGNFQKVKQGIENLIRAKKELKKKHPYVILQFIVFKTNEHQLKDVKKLKKTLGIDKVVIKSAQVYSSEDKNQLIPKNKKYKRYRSKNKDEWQIRKPLPNKCKRMWQSSVITWDGQVVPCCFDKNANFQMGNLIENTFFEIKNNEKYTQFRKQVFTDRSQINICKNCTEGI
jgi:radical SAM protein with 4Fe4S-binding SPASM domain